MRSRTALVLLGAVAVLAAGCQLRLATDLTVERGGSGSFEVAVALDEELATRLRDAGFDPLAGLEDVRDRAPGWEVTTGSGDEGGVAVRVRTDFDDPAGFGAAAASLNEALDPDDVRLFDGLELELRDGGAVAVTGAVGLRLPAAPGAEGTGVDFDRDDLERFLEERGDEYVRYDVRVTLPAPPVEHDGDRVEGSTVVWDAPLGSSRDISALSEPPGPPPWVWWVAIGAGSAAVAAGAVLALRRRS